MVKIGPPSPKVNILPDDEQSTYADTYIETWQIMKFFLEIMKPVRMADLKSEDRRCLICHEDFAEGLHRAVELPCNHVFGKSCIEEWLRPYAIWTPDVGNAGGVPVGANTCPHCRRAFFPRQRVVDSMVEIEARIKLWDNSYEAFGISRSETQIEAREDLLQYLNHYYRVHGFNDYYPSVTAVPAYKTWAGRRLFDYSLALKGTSLTPVQENLRLKLEAVARTFVPTYGWIQNDEGEISFRREDDSWAYELLYGELIESRESYENHENQESNESHEEAEVEEESAELAEGDSEEMRFFRILLR